MIKSQFDASARTTSYLVYSTTALGYIIYAVKSRKLSPE